MDFGLAHVDVCVVWRVGDGPSKMSLMTPQQFVNESRRKLLHLDVEGSQGAQLSFATGTEIFTGTGTGTGTGKTIGTEPGSESSSGSNVARA